MKIDEKYKLSIMIATAAYDQFQKIKDKLDLKNTDFKSFALGFSLGIFQSVPTPGSEEESV